MNKNPNGGNDKMKDKKFLKTSGLAIAGLILGAGGAGIAMEPQVVYENVTVEVPIEVPVEVIKEINNTVEVIKEVNVTDARLGEVIQHIFDREGDVEYIVDEFDADEIDQIADAFIFVHEMVKDGSDYIKKEIADELDKETIGETELDEDDIERIRISDDLDEVTLEDFDAEDKELDITYNVKFEHDDEDYQAEVKIEVRDGKVDDIEIVSLNKN